MMTKIKIGLVLAGLMWLSAGIAAAQTAGLNAYLFYGQGCPHCAKELVFWQTMLKKYPQVNLHKYEIYYDSNNNEAARKAAAGLDIEAGGVPFLIIGDQPLIGYAAGITDKEIENRILACLKNTCPDKTAEILGIETIRETPVPVMIPEPTPAMPAAEEKTEELPVNLPLIGQTDVSGLSLPVLTVVLAGLDGFNPCAMWTLLFLISLLLGIKDRKRMWILGAAFIVSSAAVYFMFLAAWLNLFLYLGLAIWVRVFVGVAAIGAGGYYLRDYAVNKTGGCNVTGDEKRQRVFEKIRAIVEKKSFGLALIGIVLLAAAVNLVELICSAGLPAIYTKILSLSHLPVWQYYGYLLLYILVFMLDDLFVFFGAMITLRAIGVQSKYARLSHLIGGYLMLVIGLLLLFKPEWLMFG